MPTLQVVAKVSEDDRHSEDVETVIAHNGKIYTGANEGRCRIWSSDLKLLHDIKAHDYAISHLMIKDDHLYTASVDMTVKKWSLKDLSLVGVVAKHEESIRRIDDNETYLFAGDEKGEVRMWTLEGQLKSIYEVVEEVWDMRVEGDLMYCIRDRDLVVTERKDDTKHFSVMATFPGRAPLHVNEKHVIFTDRTGKDIQIRKKSPPDFPLEHELKGHELIVTSLSGYDKYLLSGGWDKKVILWDTEAGQKLTECSLDSTPNGIAATKDGVYIVGEDGFLVKLEIKL